VFVDGGVSRHLCEQVIRAASTAARLGLMTGNQGNFSARDPDSGLVVITPHDRPYDSMTGDDLVVVDVDGAVIAGHHEPSYELPVHCTVYRERPGVMAVAHTEPSYVNVFGALGRPIPPVTATGLKCAGGTVPVTEFARTRDVAFALAMLAAMGDAHAVVWGNHGLLVVAPTIAVAVERSAAIEQNAQILYLALQLGEPRTLAWVEDVGMVVA
jgi:ribulose-5-phosphate 4-epimerase/fuculose-1-phosphate aldolase